MLAAGVRDFRTHFQPRRKTRESIDELLGNRIGVLSGRTTSHRFAARLSLESFSHRDDRSGIDNDQVIWPGTDRVSRSFSVGFMIARQQPQFERRK